MSNKPKLKNFDEKMQISKKLPDFLNFGQNKKKKNIFVQYNFSYFWPLVGQLNFNFTKKWKHF